MNNPIVAFTKILPALAMACALAAIAAQPAAAQTATSLKCKGCLTSKQLKNGSIKGKDLKDSTVTGSKMAPNAVNGGTIVDGSVGSADLANGAVNTAKIADGAVGNADLANDAVDSSKVAADSLTAGDLATNSVTAAEIAASAVGSSEVTSNSIPSGDLSNEAGLDFIDGNQTFSLTGGDDIVRSIVVTAPTSGVVVVNASGYFRMNSVPGTAECTITTGIVNDSARAIFLEFDPGTVFGLLPFAATRGFNVAAGATTIRLVCDESAGNVQVADSILTAVFSPTRY